MQRVMEHLRVLNVHTARTEEEQSNAFYFQSLPATFSQVTRPAAQSSLSRMRLFVCRHGERMDVVFGKHWVTQCFDSKGLFAAQIDATALNPQLSTHCSFGPSQADTFAPTSTCRPACRPEAEVSATTIKIVQSQCLAPLRPAS